MVERRALAIAVVVAVMPGVAAADDPKVEAKHHIARATELHDQNKFAAALDELKTAYALDPQPPLLYAMGQIHVSLGECPQAIVYYQRFIDSHPDPGAANAAREAIGICRTNPPPAIATREPVAEPVKPVAPASPPPSSKPVHVGGALRAEGRTLPWYSDIVGDGLVVGGIAAGVASALFYRSATQARDQADSAADYDAYSRLIDHAHSQRTYALGVGIGAGALITAGVLHYALADRHEKLDVTPLAAGGAAVTWTGQW